MAHQKARGPGPEWFAFLKRERARQKPKPPARRLKAVSHCSCCSQRPPFDAAEPRLRGGINIPPPDWLDATFVIDPKQLLADVRKILNEQGGKHIRSVVLIDELRKIEKWKSLSPDRSEGGRGLSRWLGKLGVEPCGFYGDSTRQRGYRRKDIESAIDKHLSQ